MTVGLQKLVGVVGLLIFPPQWLVQIGIKWTTKSRADLDWDSEGFFRCLRHAVGYSLVEVTVEEGAMVEF
jgi:hypothetical protein